MLRPTPAVSGIEALEARIAPAKIILAPGSLAFPAGTTDFGAQGTGATASLLLNKGDSLVLASETPGGAETLLFQVTGGKALLLTDGNTDNGWDANEITGVAVSDKFNGTAAVSIHGDVATTLDTAGLFTPTTLQVASIAGLSVKGFIGGDVLAGGNIAKLNPERTGLTSATARCPYQSGQLSCHSERPMRLDRPPSFHAPLCPCRTIGRTHYIFIRSCNRACQESSRKCEVVSSRDGRPASAANRCIARRLSNSNSSRKVARFKTARGCSWTKRRR